MTRTRTGDPWMPADDFGRSLPKFSVNLLVRDVARSVTFYRDVLGAVAVYSDPDFAALELAGWRFMLHADHAYDGHPLYPRVHGTSERGTGAELRLFGVNPDEVEARARADRAAVVQPAEDKPHGWRDVIVTDPDGYIWAVGMPLPK